MKRWQARVNAITDVKLQAMDIPAVSTPHLYYNALALAGEAGEFANVVKKHWRGDADPDFHDKACDELADVIITAYITSRVLQVDFDAICENKVLKLMERWPDCGQEVRMRELSSDAENLVSSDRRS